MPEVEKTEFSFDGSEDSLKKPENREKSAKNVENDEISVEIVDDTPPEDRNREPMPKEIVEELENDDLEEYSEKVKRRLAQMKKVWHDERREKERILRERDEAARFAQHQFEYNRRLRQQLAEGGKVFKSEMTRAATQSVESAKAKLKAAYENGDADEIASAQEALMDAKLKLRESETFRPPLQEEDEGVERQSQTRVPERVTPDPKAKAWQEQNTWFGTDEEMTALALGLHEKLVKSGVDPNSDDYYRQIDRTMRRRFPEYFDGDAENPPEREQPKKPTSQRKSSTVVAPVTRTTGPRQVRLTPSQIAIARRLGLSNEDYAREVMKLEAGNNG